MSGPAVERVVLLDEDGHACGAADKNSVHHAETPLHLAFSCYVLDPDGRLLVTRRALSKATFPGVWTNTCCGHPAPGEHVEDAVVRRVQQELGLSLSDVRLVLPRFRYRAVMDDGVAENEMCPVYVATSADDVRADPDEVEEHRWEPWPEFRESVLRGRDVSSWCREQVAELPADLVGTPDRPRSELPLAARLPGTPPGYRSPMTTTPQEPDPDAATLDTEDDADPGPSPIPGEKQTPGAEPDDPEYEHESRQRIEGGEPT